MPIFAAIDLIDGRSARAASGERRAGHTAHRLVVAVAGARYRGRGVVEAAEDVDVVAERRERRQARREVEVAAGLGWESSIAPGCRCR